MQQFCGLEFRAIGFVPRLARSGKNDRLGSKPPQNPLGSHLDVVGILHPVPHYLTLVYQGHAGISGSTVPLGAHNEIVPTMHKGP